MNAKETREAKAARERAAIMNGTSRQNLLLLLELLPDNLSGRMAAAEINKALDHLNAIKLILDQLKTQL
jgi:hypothetical protein